MIEQDAQLLTSIQKTLSEDPYANQRTLAQESHISLGMMNAVLKRCMERGWIAVKNLNMKKVCYYLTPEGMNQVTRRTTGYLSRSFELMNTYAEKIQTVIENAKNSGKTKVLLYGNSNITFLIVYACEQNGILFEQVDIEQKDIQPAIDPAALCLAGELNDAEEQERLVEGGCCSVFDIV